MTQRHGEAGRRAAKAGDLAAATPSGSLNGRLLMTALISCSEHHIPSVERCGCILTKIVQTKRVDAMLQSVSALADRVKNPCYAASQPALARVSRQSLAGGGGWDGKRQGIWKVASWIQRRDGPFGVLAGSNRFFSASVGWLLINRVRVQRWVLARQDRRRASTARVF